MSPRNGPINAAPAGRRTRLARAAVASGAALVLGLAVCVPAASSEPADSVSAATSATATATATATQSCAWPSEASVQTHDGGGPDSAEAAWIQPIVAGADTRFVILGSFPDARFASLAVYTPTGDSFTSNGVSSTLTDYQIVPAPGSRNPWRQHAAPGGRYTASIRSDASPRQINTLPMPSGTTAQYPGYLLYRVYVPAGGDFSRVPLPTVIVQQGRSTRILLPCKEHTGPLPVPSPSPTPTASPSSTGTPALPPQLAFFKPSAALVDATFPNADSAYAEAYFVRPSASDVVVVTAEAPVAAPGDHPSRWPAPGEDMRYWSLCVVEGIATLPTVVNTLPDGQVDYGCRDNDNTRLDPAGDYAYVIGAESQSTAIDAVPGATFLPFATDQTSPVYVLWLRNMLISNQFTDTTNSTAVTGDPAAAATAMGPYYPRIAVCPLTVLTTQGIQACLAA